MLGAPIQTVAVEEEHLDAEIEEDSENFKEISEVAELEKKRKIQA